VFTGVDDLRVVHTITSDRQRSIHLATMTANRSSTTALIRAMADGVVLLKQQIQPARLHHKNANQGYLP